MIRAIVCVLASTIAFYTTLTTGLPGNVSAAKYLDAIPTLALPAIYGIVIGSVLAIPVWPASVVLLALIGYATPVVLMYGTTSLVL